MDTKTTLNEKAAEFLKKAQSVLLCVNNRSSLDTHYAAVALKRFLESEGKNLTIVSNGALILKHRLMFEQEGVECADELQSQSYVITVDHRDVAIDRVSYDDKDGKFRLYITPVAGNKEFNFKKVSYAEGGANAEAIVVLGCRSLKWMNEIYESNKEFFDKTPVINVNNLSGVQEYGTVKLTDEGMSVSELVLGVLDLMGEGKMTKEISDMVLRGIIDFVQPFQKSTYRVSSMENAVAMIKNGADLKEAFGRLYFDRTYRNVELQRKVMSNFIFDEKTGVAWSSVSGIDLAQCGVDRESFILDGRIIFNICSDFRVACVLYEVQNGEIVVELESNDPLLDAREVFTNYKVAGTSSRIFFTLRDKSLSDAQEEIVEGVSRRVGIVGGEVNSKAGITDDDKTREPSEREEGGDEDDAMSGKEVARVADVEKKAVNKRKNGVDSRSPATGGLVTPPPFSAEES